MERQKINDTMIESINQLKTSGTIDIKIMEDAVDSIINNILNLIKEGKGRFSTLSQTFSKLDKGTWVHSVNSAIYALIISYALPDIFESKSEYSVSTYNRSQILVFNMLLHDIGKIRIPEEILNKKERLTPREIAIIQRHPYEGSIYLKKVNEKLKQKNMKLIPSTFRVACLHHHQYYNGSGYPAVKIGIDEVRPLVEREIPIIGRIASVVNVYDSLTSKQPWRLPMHPTDAIKVLEKEASKKLDPL